MRICIKNEKRTCEIKQIWYGILPLLTIIFISACIKKNTGLSINEGDIAIEMRMIVAAQIFYYENFNTFGSAEQLIAAQRIPNEVITNYKGYRFSISATGNKFEVKASPLIYGKNSRLSFYASSLDGHVRGANHQGKPANENDPVVLANPPERKMPIFDEKSSPMTPLPSPAIKKSVAQ